MKFHRGRKSEVFIDGETGEEYTIEDIREIGRDVARTWVQANALPPDVAQRIRSRLAKEN